MNFEGHNSVYSNVRKNLYTDTHTEMGGKKEKERERWREKEKQILIFADSESKA